MTPLRAGHRAVPHTADVRIEAWAPTREKCITEAARGMVETFADVRDAEPQTVRRRTLVAASDEELLVAVLDEMVFLMDAAGELAVRAELTPTPTGAEVDLGVVPTRLLEQVGAVPKAVSLHELRLEPGPEGWSCSVTLDV